MGRPKHITLGGYFYHILNRASGRLRIFKKDVDFAAVDLTQGPVTLPPDGTQQVHREKEKKRKTEKSTGHLPPPS